LSFAAENLLIAEMQVDRRLKPKIKGLDFKEDLITVFQTFFNQLVFFDAVLLKLFSVVDAILLEASFAQKAWNSLNAGEVQLLR
jgi:hypothetical protein